MHLSFKTNWLKSCFTFQMITYLLTFTAIVLYCRIYWPSTKLNQVRIQNNQIDHLRFSIMLYIWDDHKTNLCSYTYKLNQVGIQNDEMDHFRFSILMQFNDRSSVGKAKHFFFGKIRFQWMFQTTNFSI